MKHGLDCTPNTLNELIISNTDSLLSDIKETFEIPDIIMLIHLLEYSEYICEVI